MTNRCQHCGTGDHCQCALDHRAAQEHATARRHLEQIPDLYANLSLFLVRGSTGEGIMGAPSGSRPPMDLGVIDLLDERNKRDCEPWRTADELDRDRDAGVRRLGVLPTLAQWTRLVDSELWDEGVEHDGLPDSPTIVSECGFLLAHLAWCAKQMWFDELAEDVRKIRADIRTAIRDRDITENLVCIKPGCGWDVRPMDSGSWFKCSGCGESWGRVELHKMAERKRPRPLKECAVVAGTSVRTLRRAIERGELKHVAADGSKRLFDVQDVVVAAAKAKMDEARTA